ncbi:gluconolactonase precursor [Cellvibrio japonicus Ueda107]|uniref:Gluconolactonase n=2 Tax=Cellvibrio japonicus TaxID=155077 RepID=B3PHE7_CELJU|nr:gluconolactonase precursor [Cellvibrio japonicus Ueda107]
MPHHSTAWQFHIYSEVDMTQHIKTILFFSSLFGAAAMAGGVQVQTQDFVGDGVFTAGIEGPAVDAQGHLYAVNFAEEGTIGVVDPHGNARLLLKLPEGSTGNGIRFGPDGVMYVADYTGHNILKIHPRTLQVAVYAHSAAMNQPNDIAIARDGTIYASDPNWSDSTGNLWMIAPDGKVTLLEREMGTTNGIEVSADEQRVYVNESVQRKVWQYDRDPKTGKLANKRLLIEFPDHGLDGMRSDSQGNLYIARYGAGVIAVVSPAGDLLHTISLKGEKPTNLAFGGEDGRRVYVTLQDRGAIETFTAPHPGREWALWRRD